MFGIKLQLLVSNSGFLPSVTQKMIRSLHNSVQCDECNNIENEIGLGAMSYGNGLMAVACNTTSTPPLRRGHSRTKKPRKLSTVFFPSPFPRHCTRLKSGFIIQESPVHGKFNTDEVLYLRSLLDQRPWGSGDWIMTF